MIQALIQVLQSSGLEWTDDEIADAIWLASYIDLEPSTVKPSLQSEPPAQNSLRVEEMSDENQIWSDDSGVNDSRLASGSSVTRSRKPAAEIHIPGENIDQHETVPFHSPTATALPGKLALARSLRPLMRQIASYTGVKLDEVATAQRVADEHILAPVLQPGKERWLDLVVVVDEWSTMFIWRETVVEFIELLQQIGAFRTVKTYRLSIEKRNYQIGDMTAHAQIRATQGGDGSRGRAIHQRELTDPGGRRLILVVSDCTAPIWANGQVGRLLTDWGTTNMVALVQMLPATLWNSSALADAVQVYLSAKSAGLSNRDLDTELPWHWSGKDKPVGHPVPVITLEPEAIKVWTNLLVGKGGIQAPGFFLPMEPNKEFQSERAPTLSVMTPEELWQRFRATASPLARELAGYLAAAPLSLSVIRLVQRVMLPQSRQTHLAEVFRSGLIERVTPLVEKGTAEEIHYEFVEGVREFLLATVLLSDTKLIFQKVSEILVLAMINYTTFLLCFPTLLVGVNLTLTRQIYPSPISQLLYYAGLVADIPSWHGRLRTSL